MSDDKSRMVVCLIVALIPLGNHVLFTNVTYSQWHILFLALCIIIAPLPMSSLARSAQFIVLTLLIFSHPLNVIFIPICVVLFFTRPSLPDRITNISIIFLTILYVVFCTKTANINFSVDVDTFLVTCKLITHRVIFESNFGNHLRLFFQDVNQSLVINVFAFGLLCVLGMVIFLLAKAKRLTLRSDLSLLIFLLFVIFLLTFISVISRSMSFESHFYRYEHRYFYLQQLFLVFSLALYLVRLVNSRRLAFGQSMFILLLLTGTDGLYLNVYNAEDFRTSKVQGIETMKFLKIANRRLGNSNNEKYGTQIILPRGGIWDIKINLYNNRAQFPSKEH